MAVVNHFSPLLSVTLAILVIHPVYGAHRKLKADATPDINHWRRSIYEIQCPPGCYPSTQQDCLDDLCYDSPYIQTCHCPPPGVAGYPSPPNPPRPPSPPPRPPPPRSPPLPPSPSILKKNYPPSVGPPGSPDGVNNATDGSNNNNTGVKHLSSAQMAGLIIGIVGVVVGAISLVYGMAHLNNSGSGEASGCCCWPSNPGGTTDKQDPYANTTTTSTSSKKLVSTSPSSMPLAEGSQAVSLRQQYSSSTRASGGGNGSVRGMIARTSSR